MTNLIPIPETVEAPAELAQISRTLGPPVEVKDAFTYATAGGMLVKVRDGIKQIEEFFNPLIASAHKLHKSLTQAKGQTIGPLEAYRQETGRRMQAWKDTEARRAAELQAKLQAEADEKARKERERLEARAEKAADKGQDEKAQALIAQAAAVQAQAIQVQTSVPKVEGIKEARLLYKARIVNPALVPDEYWMIDEAKINAYARATKGTVPLAGVEFYTEKARL